MLTNFTEQMKKSSKPAQDLFLVNMSALKTISAHQTQFLAGMVNENAKLMKAYTKQNDMSGYIAANSSYIEQVREQLTSTTKSTLQELNKVSGQYAGLLKSSLVTNINAVKDVEEKVVAASSPATSSELKATSAPAKKAVTKAPTKTVATKKVVTKKAPAKSKATTKKAEAPKAAAKAETVKVAAEAKKPAAKQASKPASKTTAAKKAPTKAVKKQSSTKTISDTPPAVKATAKKPVATLNADNVRATPKTETK